MRHRARVLLACCWRKLEGRKTGQVFWGEGKKKREKSGLEASAGAPFAQP